MKIKKLSINQYGCIEDKKLEFGEEISIIKGDNESGKSTMHQAMLALMFGFANNSRRQNFALAPKAKPFKGGYPSLQAQCSDEAGEYTISRYFDKQKPKVNITKGSISTVADNEPMSHLQNVSRQTYEGIYSLDIEQIVALKDSWEREQDSILSGLHPDFLLPHESIISDLDVKIKEVWKGKTQSKLTKAKEIEDKIKELKIQRRQALVDQKTLRELETEQEETQEGIEKSTASIQDMAKEEVKLSRQQRFYEEYSAIMDLNSNTSDIDKYNDIPHDIEGFFEGHDKIIKECTAKINDLQKKKYLLTDTINEYQRQYKKIMHCKEVVPKAVSVESKLSGVHASLVKDIDREKQKRSQILLKLKRLFTNNFSIDKLKDIMYINIAECLALSDSVQRLQVEKGELSEKALKRRVPAKKIEKMDIILGIALLIGLLLIFVPLGISKVITVIAGVLLVAGVVTTIYLKKPKIAKSDDEISVQLDKIDTQYHMALTQLQAQLNYDFIPEQKKRHPDKSLIDSIAQLQDDYIEITQLGEAIEKDKIEAKQKEDEIKEIAIDVLGYSNHYETDTADMKRKLDTMLQLEMDANNADSKVKMINEQIKEQEIKIQSSTRLMESTAKSLYSVIGETTKKKISNLKSMRTQQVSAAGRDKVIRQKYQDYDELVEATDKNVEGKLFDVQLQIKTLESMLEKEREKQQELSTKSGAVKSKIEHLLKSGLNPAIVDGQISDAKAQKAQCVRKRDEYVLAYGIIKKAREKFISEFNPLFLNKASEYLAIITDGRYNQIKLSESGTSIMVMQDSTNSFDFDAIDETISRGTREQIYLSLRLAMLDRFDPQGQKLPIILDEALVNWDMVRFGKLMKIIDNIAKERQVFMFTCHDYVVDIVAENNSNYKLINI